MSCLIFFHQCFALLVLNVFSLIDCKADPSSVDQKKRPAVGKQEVGTQICYQNICFDIVQFI